MKKSVRFAFSLLCCLYGFSAWSQNNHAGPVSVLAQTGTNDSIRVELLLHAASSLGPETDYSKTRAYLDSALQVSQATHSRKYILESYAALAALDSLSGKFDLAFREFRMYAIYGDSARKDENIGKSTQLRMQYDFDKQQAKRKADQDKRNAIDKAEHKKTMIIIYAAAGGLLLIVGLFFIVYRDLRRNRAKNAIIEKQKEMVEEKQKEILDSIQYAKRIQRAQLPTERYIHNKLSSFLQHKE